MWDEFCRTANYLSLSESELIGVGIVRIFDAIFPTPYSLLPTPYSLC
ncbi:MAG: hypothetical protein F6J90_07050 [Moorea sp. SIOASIH]|nr:hypothetical protein [Moorena sp. SIOASIH]NEO36095.1 hypothetical protein [Moorena sp. SIOASIH]